MTSDEYECSDNNNILIAMNIMWVMFMILSCVYFKKRPIATLKNNTQQTDDMYMYYTLIVEPDNTVNTSIEYMV